MMEVSELRVMLNLRQNSSIEVSVKTSLLANDSGSIIGSGERASSVRMRARWRFMAYSVGRCAIRQGWLVCCTFCSGQGKD